ncbi:MAG: hypothetical protein FRX48_04808 [Lasallia pustulata]|uniref:Translation machinery-associated protein 16 n=1 Tax=Lasallia pustulata TaxID=136370 RepID=A0A5M8PPS1_9LECA|nr:MAG: hypothetical protein FRX48_04808 [Lasallia pustulata]
MPKSLAKVHKQISKKTKGNISSLHENSRNSQRLRRAGARDDKIARVSKARAKANRPRLQRVAFFQGAAIAADGPIDVEVMQMLIQRHIQRDDEELATLKSERRPGRPSSTREDLLGQRIATEQREYDTGFWLPDMEDKENLRLLRDWNGEWTSLSTVKYIRLSRNGLRHESSFPPNGES